MLGNSPESVSNILLESYGNKGVLRQPLFCSLENQRMGQRPGDLQSYWGAFVFPSNEKGGNHDTIKFESGLLLRQ